MKCDGTVSYGSDDEIDRARVSTAMNAARKVPAALIALALLFGCAAGRANAQGDDSEPAPPPGATLVREVQAGGVQIYACRANRAGTLQWTLTGPKALLIDDDGSDFGTHGAGPTWTAADGSSISADGAHPLAKIDRAPNVPALLLAVTAAHGAGVLSGVRFVRRAQTSGGMAPATGCDAEHINATTASRYTALYTFYR
jgi:hypothetical protein